MNTASQPKATSKQMKDQHEVTVIIMPVPLLNFMAWISNHMPNEVLEDEITYPLPNFNGTAVEVWEWVWFHPTLYDGCRDNYLSMLGLKLIHVSKRGGVRHIEGWWRI